MDIKRYWVLAWDYYYPEARLNNVRGTFYTEEEANEYKNIIKNAYDNSYVEDVGYMLGIPD